MKGRSRDDTSEPTGLAASLAEHVGDLREALAEERRKHLPDFDPPEGVEILDAAALAKLVVGMRDAERSLPAIAVRSVFGSMTALVARALIRAGQRVLVVSADADRATALRDDLRFFSSDQPNATVLGYVPPDTTPFAEINPDRRAAQIRLATLTHLARKLPWAALSIPVGALARKVVPKQTVLAHFVEVKVDDELDRDAFSRALGAAGYARAPIVEDPGSFALRGSIIDAWAPNEDRPVRIELLGDGVLGIKEFDPETQRTGRERKSVGFCLSREAPLTPELLDRARVRVRALCDAVDMPSAKARALCDDVASGRTFFGQDGFLPAFVDLAPLGEYLDGDVVVLVEDPPRVTSELRDELGRAQADFEHGHAAVAFPLDSFYTDEATALRELAVHPVLALHGSLAARTAADAEGFELLEVADIDAPSLYSFDQFELVHALEAHRAGGKGRGLEPLNDRLHHLVELGLHVVIVTRTDTQADRLTTLLAHGGVRARILPRGEAPWLSTSGGSPEVFVTQGTLSRGVVAPGERLALITEEEIFGARALRRNRRARGASAGSTTTKSKTRAFVEDLKSLAIGDLVVHGEHGIGRYLGLVHRDIGGARVDLLAVEYQGGDKLYLPVYRLNQIQKFSGGEGTPKLDRLGGQTFAKSKARAAREVRQMADELLKLYAERRAATRDPYPAVDDEYRTFEATFPFEETPDQATAIADVERDLELPSPMDRLVCGDVGFGKTEIAMRAAFRAAMAGRQVAILCPTTVLSQQHFSGFSARFSGYPIVVKALSRFSSKSAQDEVVRGLKSGAVDVVIGTHRLLSKDVHYKRLGLLVVDEEQRFGVSHKERIKQLKNAVDVLTLTATPIPRTLQMAVSGLRDMSIIGTPPVDRRAIRTIITRADPTVLREAVQRELDRGGQVYYVYNRVEGLYERAHRLQELVPSARVAVAHGQLNEATLERTMLDFVEGRYDVLCATAIIESGLDIPRANTMIIDRADMFGLAQLYQLRGRVGRSRERAYCYLVAPPVNELTDEARSRIEAIERHTELGSGFQVASLDLELRGGGDLLGAEQSGSIDAVGFELFCQMLEEAVQELRGETVVHEVDPELSIDDEALLPEEYIEDVGVRLSLYKRLACADGDGEVQEIASEMEDRFGPPPDAVKRFIRLMRLKTELRALRALGCEASARTVTIHFREDAPLDTKKVLALVQSKRALYKMTPDMRITRRITPTDPVNSGLDAADLILSELVKCAA
ncbi:MAG: transcription-repair coupling factor [Polyangiaceae bacterium]